MQEHRTTEMTARHLADHGYEVTTGVGKTGVVGLLRNGDGHGRGREHGAGRPCLRP